ncbi:phosphotransferase [Streptomyces sp. NBC_01728]|nr:phosphotransferase [Streptomyces sp. NBC_01719]MCX4493125.1 phosphotransferase [Streptomyces sp. NBC_01728]
MRTGRLIGSGRSADVFEVEGERGWVVRRDRDGWGDAAAEAAVMEYVRGHGYPVPAVRAATRAPMRARTHLFISHAIPMECDLSSRAAAQHHYGDRYAAPLQLPGLPGRLPAPCAGEGVRMCSRGVERLPA